MSFLLTAALFAAPAASIQAAAAPAPVAQTIACPVGGTSFRYTPMRPGPAVGERPDGRPYAEGVFPLRLPECPDNGLVLYKEYSAEEVAKLEPLIASESYAALRKQDSQYYRAYWLMKEMGVEPQRYLLALLQASWEAEGKPELRTRYLAELAAESEKVGARPTDLNWIGMEARAVNALRELGRFDEAAARLAKVPLAALEVPMPTGAAATKEAVAKARVRRGWLNLLNGLKAAIEAKDSTMEPLTLLPRTVAFARCLDRQDVLSAADKGFCEKESAAVEGYRAARAKLAKEMDALKRSREASGR
jgi:hypothetical protein